MGGIKDVLAHEEMLVIENGRLAEDIDDLRSDLSIERASHEACHDYFDMLIGIHKEEIEELKEDLATEIDNHVECHKAFDVVLEDLGLAVADVVEDRDFWQRSFDELSAHTIQLQRELNDTRNVLAVAEFTIDQQNDAIDGLGVQVVAFADLKADIFDAFANAFAQYDHETGYQYITESILESLFDNASETFDAIAREAQRETARRQEVAA